MWRGIGKDRKIIILTPPFLKEIFRVLPNWGGEGGLHGVGGGLHGVGGIWGSVSVTYKPCSKREFMLKNNKSCH